jgi:hypothetical protein
MITLKRNLKLEMQMLFFIIEDLFTLLLNFLNNQILIKHFLKLDLINLSLIYLIKLK